MAIKYPQYINNISPTENVGDSLVKINNNFVNLQTGLCDLKKQIDSLVQIRTFFYYGPNASQDATSGMQNNITSRPSNLTIENFVNQTTQLNLPSISDTGDIAYVIYQKTGYLTKESIRNVTGTTPVVGTQAVITGSYTLGDQTFPSGSTQPITKYASWATTSPDIYNNFSPAFIIWKLVYNGTTYRVDSGFPVFTQAETLSTPNWNNPRAWSKY